KKRIFIGSMQACHLIHPSSHTCARAPFVQTARFAHPHDPSPFVGPSPYPSVRRPSALDKPEARPFVPPTIPASAPAPVHPYPSPPHTSMPILRCLLLPLRSPSIAPPPD